jgi:hypothetical protein
MQDAKIQLEDIRGAIPICRTTFFITMGKGNTERSPFAEQLLTMIWLRRWGVLPIHCISIPPKHLG